MFPDRALSTKKLIDKQGALCYNIVCRRLKANDFAWVAQLVEQWTENPRVAGSSPVPGIKGFMAYLKNLQNPEFAGFFGYLNLSLLWKI